MRLFFDSFWRALAYSLHLRVMLLSLLPLVLLMVVAWGWGYFYWEPAVSWVRDGLEGWPLLQKIWGWAVALGAARISAAMAPLIVIFAITPLLILLCLLAVSLMMGPALVEMVAQRRFRGMTRQHGGSVLASLGWTLGSTLIAGVLMLLSMPLWWIPPLIFVLPPLIWGWLTYRVMAFDALAVHASRDERQELLRRHRLWLLLMGVLSGFMGAAPSLVWASGALFAAAFVVLVPVAIWIYAVVFAFTALWFIHFGLAALQDLRRESDAANVTGAVTTDTLGWSNEPKHPPH
ncbi:MAG: EI24 domain-containing protein [Limnohabitans sp.]|nr:EI24 domain-containing protein [Limnohabitans sp.]